MSRTIFIGDVHGCAEEFGELLSVVNLQMLDRLLLPGDAFTKGPDPEGVWSLICESSAEMVMGNHDGELLVKLSQRLAGKERKMKPDHKRILDSLMPVHDDLVPLLESMPLYLSESEFLLVHAGINPEKELEGTSRDEFLAIRTWPPQKGIEGPRWHDVYRPIRPLVVFGHDVVGGLVLKRHATKQPYLIGLDSGCVYGGKLSAYVLEEDRLVEVKSKQPARY